MTTNGPHSHGAALGYALASALLSKRNDHQDVVDYDVVEIDGVLYAEPSGLGDPRVDLPTLIAQIGGGLIRGHEGTILKQLLTASGLVDDLPAMEQALAQARPQIDQYLSGVDLSEVASRVVNGARGSNASLLDCAVNPSSALTLGGGGVLIGLALSKLLS